MSKISIAAALELVDVSKTTLYRDLKENKLSATTNARGKKVIDTAELERFYGKLKSPPGIEAGHNGNPQSDPIEHNGTLEKQVADTSAHNGTLEKQAADTSAHNGTLEKQVADTSAHNGTLDTHPAVIDVLADQVELLKSQLESEREEKSKLIDMLAMEQEKTKVLMLPPPPQAPVKKKASWFGYFRLKR